MKKFKRLTSIIASICILMSTAVPYAMAEETQAIEEIHITSGNNNNCIVIQSQTSTEFNIYRKGTDGALTLVDLPNAKDNDGNTTSDDKWQYCNHRLYLDENLENGREYIYVVKALDADGNEIGDGAEVSGTPFETAMNQTKFKVNSYWSYWNGSNYTYGYAAEKAGIGVDGSAGLFISKMAEHDGNNGFMSITYGFGKRMPENTVYKLTWKQKLTKCNYDANGGYRVQGQTSLDGTTWGEGTFLKLPDEERDGNWHEKTMYIKGTGQDSVEFYIIKCTGDLVVDDFALYQIDAETLEPIDNNNMLSDCNPGFEDAFELPEEVEEAHVIPGKGFNCIAIQNSADVGINVYKKSEDGSLTPANLSNAKDNNGNATSDDRWNYCSRRLLLDENLTAGIEYTYVVKTVNAFGTESQGVEISGTPYSTENNQTKFNVNKFWSYWNGSNYTYGYATEKDGIGVDGSAGLYISKLAENDESNGFMSITYNFGKILSENKVYKLIWQQKLSKCNWAGNDGYRIQCQSSTDGVNWNGATAVPFTQGENDGNWHEKVMYIKGTGQDSAEFYVLKCTSDLVLDNFRLYEVDAETLEPVDGNNMLSDRNSDFEDNYTVPDDVAFANVIPKDECNEIMLRGDAYSYNIYRESEDGWEKLNLPVEKTFENDGYTINLYSDTGLTNNVEYTYMIKAVSESGLESTGMKYSATPLEDYAIGEDNFHTTYEYNEWIGHNYGPVSNYGGVYITADEGVDSTPAIKMINNLNYTDNTYASVTYTQTGVKQGTTYRLSFMTKTGAHNKAADTCQIKTIDACLFDADGAEIGVDAWKLGVLSGNNNEWFENVYYVEATGEKIQIEIMIQQFAECVIMDNFTLYEVDENMEVVSGAENIFADGDFAPETDHVWVETKYYAGYPSYTEDYGKKIADDAEILFVVDLNEYETDAIYAETIIKNVGNDAIEPVLLLAIYKDGALYDVVRMGVTVQGVTKYGKASVFGQIYTVPNPSDNYSAKVMVWDGMDSLSPYAPATEIASK